MSFTRYRGWPLLCLNEGRYVTLTVGFLLPGLFTFRLWVWGACLDLTLGRPPRRA